ncbi:hypothetical protein EZS27_009900 [termite gut metagenome]|uniref:Uncharacterized protein n=1 Tax=termite gut metagenome TaxID=433724 RepID=A0A5J4SAP2_9ZZZZ
MELVSLKYVRNRNANNEWQIVGSPIEGEENYPLTFKKINLIVGKNATGKSNTVRTIQDLASLLSGTKKPNELLYTTATYDVIFKNGEKNISYYVDYEHGTVRDEKLNINSRLLLDRKENLLFYNELDKMVSFKTDDNILAITRRDSKQQDFFDDLYYWGLNLSYYAFGSTLGKDTYAFSKDLSIQFQDPFYLKNTNKVSVLFIKGINKDSKFKRGIINDMKTIDYQLNEIDVRPLKGIQSLKNTSDIFGLSIEEEGLKSDIDQNEISQGMFRVLSLIIQMNYSLLFGISDCVLIDDIGEGLDYERSQSLINLIIKKAKKFQVIMTSNDRFVMNKIPLEYWEVIKRENNKSIFYNIRNSQEVFEKFAYTGLNNFDFFATNFYKQEFENGNLEK